MATAAPLSVDAGLLLPPAPKPAPADLLFELVIDLANIIPPKPIHISPTADEIDAHRDFFVKVVQTFTAWSEEYLRPVDESTSDVYAKDFADTLRDILSDTQASFNNSAWDVSHPEAAE